MVANNRVGGYRDINEVKRALVFEKSELIKIETELKNRA